MDVCQNHENFVKRMSKRRLGQNAEEHNQLFDIITIIIAENESASNFTFYNWREYYIMSILKFSDA